MEAKPQDAPCAHLRAGADRVRLWVLADSARGRRFYEAAGWLPDGTVVQDMTAGRTLDELRYRRRLFG
ncbi:hypothetical protein [Streptomyces sp. NPDC058579]|uniref:hypothetical protein n=1 Tax=Streptomyces sp. NPDC058579 TaxID=3346548 RepID=UPI003654040D